VANGIDSSIQSVGFFTIPPASANVASWLMSGSKWGGATLGAGVEITYSFVTANSSFSAGYGDGQNAGAFEFTAQQKSALATTMANYSAVANLTFTQVTESATLAGDLRLGNTTASSVGTAEAYYPSSSATGGDMWFGSRYNGTANDYKTPVAGNYAYSTLQHELGHALGLQHPHEIVPIAPIARDALKYSVMSYRDFVGDDLSGYSTSFYPTTLMIDDILALQTMYGVNYAANAGDTTYSWSGTQKVFETIWDGAGIDTLNASSMAQGVVLDLNPGAFSSIGQGFSNGQATVRDCLAIAYGCDIENAIGSAYADTLIGNALSNSLIGGAGDDRLDGGLGIDTLIGGLGSDVYVVDNAGDQITESAGQGTDTVESSVTYALSGHVERLVLTGTADINATGNALNNVMTGNSGNNLLDGGAGADTMSGGGGNDTYRVDNVGDTVTEAQGGGIDTVEAGISYTLGNDFENLTLIGSGNFSGTGNALNNILIGNDGSNTLSGGAGDDLYVVGIGDTAVEAADAGTDTVRSSVTYALGANIESLVLTGNMAADGSGNELDNVITGNSAGNALSGGAGNDVLDGGLGADVLSGDAGDDIYIVDDLGDTATEQGGEGVDTVLSSVSYALGSHFEHLTLTGAGNVDGTGNEFDNALTGNSANNVLDGGTGADTMTGKAGDDVYRVDNAVDSVVENAGEGRDRVEASLDYALGEAFEDLTLTGADDIDGTGNALGNALIGNAGNNTLTGGVGDDTLDGGLGTNILIGGAGDDVYTVATADDSVVEQAGEGRDTVRSAITYELGATLENLVLTGTGNNGGIGNALDNVLAGNAGANVLDAGEGNDVLDGGQGADVLFGRQGNDLYVIDNAGDQVHENAGEGVDEVESSLTYSLGANVENLRLTGNADIDGTGNGLDNVLTDNAGVNHLRGGAGNDIYVISNAGDSVSENFGEGTDAVLASVSYTLSANVENLTLTGSGNIDAIGNAHNNILIGNSGNNLLIGFGGQDTMQGGLGDDTYIIEAGTVISELVDSGTDSVEAGFSYQLGQNLENLTLRAGISNISGSGNELGNRLIGNAGNNVLNGAGGADYLEGGSGADTLVGGVGDDTYVIDALDTVTETSGQGTDSVIADFSYGLSGALENLTLLGTGNFSGTGNSLNNRLTGNAGANVLNGGTGEDVLDGSGGADSLIGGAGWDIYFIDNTGDTVTELADSGTDTVNSSISYTLGVHVENLTLMGTSDIDATGNSFANTLTGNSGNNTLEGGAGADILDGGAGSDTLRGGAENDVYYVDDIGDVIVDTGSETFDQVRSTISYTLGSDVETLILLGTGDLNGTGNSKFNRMVGNAGDNILDGGGNADDLIGGAGDDTYIVNVASDLVTELSGEGVDTVHASGSYTLSNHVEHLVLTGTSSISGTGNALDNTITGNDANNVLNGGQGADRMIGKLGDDTYVIDHLSDTVEELAFEGSDTVQTIFSHTLSEHFENLMLLGAGALNGTGNNSNNFLSGNVSNNILIGYGGNDTLYGSLGADTMYGGTGDDYYYIDSASDIVLELAGEGWTDVIDSSIDYTLGENFESLYLSGSANLSATGNAAANFLRGNAGNNLLIGGAGNDTLSGLEGVDTAYGGIGDDTYWLDHDGDMAIEYAGEGRDLAISRFSLTLGDNIESLWMNGLLDISATGNSLENYMLGNRGNNAIDGGAGGDTLVGGKGNDVLSGGSGSDIYEFNVGDGADILIDGSLNRSENRISFKTGIDIDDLVFENVNEGVLIRYAPGDSILLQGVSHVSEAVSRIDFANNTFIDYSNKPPVVMLPIADQAATEDAVFSFTVPANTFADADLDDELSYSATLADGSALPGWLSFDATTRTFSGTPLNEQVGTLSLTVTVTDLAGAQASDTFNVAVANTNDAPTVSAALADRAATEDAAFSFTVPANTFADVDLGDVLSYSATLADGSGLPGWLSFDAQTRIFSGTPLNEHVGTLSLKVTATDLALAQASDTFNIAVANTNDAPTVSAALADRAATEDAAFSFTVPANTFADVDLGDELSYSATLADGSALPSWLSFNATTRTFSGTPLNEHVGTLSLMVTAKDLAKAQASDTFNIIVANTNDAPTVSAALTDQTVIEDAAFSFTVPANTFADADLGDVLSYSATLADGSALPGWLSFNSTTRAFTGIVPNTAAGLLELRVTATDTGDLSAYEEFRLDIANHIVGTSSANTLTGTSFRDVMEGLAGNDTYVVNGAEDTVIEQSGQGTDTIQSSVSYALSANVEHLTLTGSNNIDATGNSGNNTLTGNSGNNRLDGGTGNDAMTGRGGNDTYIVDSASDTVTESSGGGTDTVESGVTWTLGSNFERLTLTGSANINGTGNTLANILTGNIGNNTLSGGSGADSMSGDSGDDTYVVDNAGDVVTELAGQGTDTVQTSLVYTLGANVENLVVTGSNNRAGTGNELDNVLTGNSGNNTLTGLSGDDRLVGGGGSDTLVGGADNDYYVVDSTGDTVTELADAGSDTVETSLSYTLGNNVENLILTGTNNRSGTGNGLDNALTGNGANNTLTGNGGNDVLNGDAGTDTLNGGSGNDWLDGGSAADTLTGGGGQDWFVFSSIGGTNVDVIADFNVSEDRFGLHNSVFSAIAPGVLTAAAFVIGTAAGDADDRIVYNSANGNLYYDADGSGAGAAVRFAQVSSGVALTESDFVMV
jgi:trimeric autotransporter adhesin